jgi:photosystem II stability/assembly factor-like uncharacterized protein
MLRRHALLAGLASLAAAPCVALPVELAQPSVVNQRAAFGLFNAIVPAGARLVAVGERGRILLSDDAGGSWAQANVPVSVTLVTARFATDSVGYAAGNMGVVLKTEDGGLTWRKVLDGVGAASAMLAEAQVLRAAFSAAQNAAADAQAANNGTSTPLQNAQFLVSQGPANPILSLLVLNETHVMAFGAFGLALETRDGGASWAGIAARVRDPQGLHIYAARLVGGTLVLAGEQGFVLRGPVDGVLAPVTSPFPGSLFGLTAAGGTLFGYGVQGTILVSADTGATWRQVPAFANSGILSGLTLRDGRMLLGDESGNLALTADAGAKYSVLPANAPVTALAQAADGALIIGSPMGLRRLPLAALGTAS